jgi:hypothetical protein
MKDYSKFLSMISSEFDKYILEDKKILDSIPKNSIIIFQIDGEHDFNDWHKKISLQNAEKDQPVIYFNIEKWRKRSTIEKISITRKVA